MNIMEASIEGMRRIAVANSEGGKIDSHWESVLPEIEDIFANEIFLTLHRWYIDEPMEYRARQIAQKASLRDVRGLDDATLALHYLTRRMWLGISYDYKFQDFVDSNVKGFIHPPDSSHWIINASGILLPISEGIVRQIPLSLIERFKQAYFAEHCYAELVRRGRKNVVTKYAFVLLNNSDDLRQKQNEAMQWLCDKSKQIAPDVGEDALQDWLVKLSELPLHIQIQKVGATLTAISQGVIDIHRKGGKSKPISLEDKLVQDELADTTADELTTGSTEEMVTDEEFSQRLLANQKKIEEILSRESPKKRRSKIGKRRFKVLQMLIDAPTLTATEIAKRLGASDQTIGRDREVIKQSRSQISEILNL